LTNSFLLSSTDQVASTYHDNPFHNFEHACHVTMSVSKFLKRIVTPEIDLEELSNLQDKDKIAQQIASHLHDYTHGLTSDPITIFAIVFSALIHDADHRGVSNVQLGKEEPAMMALFRGKSLAEQNSLDIAWELLMSDRYKALRAYVFTTSEDLARFRQVVVNVVLATGMYFLLRPLPLSCTGVVFLFLLVCSIFHYRYL